MEFAWNVQKNKMNDVKGKEIEQDRKSDNLKNEDIDKNKTHLNYDLIKDDRTLYRRVKDRVEEVKGNSRLRKDSVVMCSNVITVNQHTFQEWGIDKTKLYFEAVTEFFQNEFGKENVVSAKVHLDETAPHMHLQFVPVSQDGKLQCKKILNRTRLDKIHTKAPKFLREKGFDVVRGEGRTGKNNIKDIYKYKVKELEKTILSKQKELDQLIQQINSLKFSLTSSNKVDIDSIKTESTLLDKSKIKIDKFDFENLINGYKSMFNKVLETSNKNNDLEKQNFNLFRENATLKAERKDNTDLKNEFYYQSEELKTEKEKNKELEKKYDSLEKENKEYFNLLKKYNIFEIEKKKKLEMQKKFEMNKKSSDVPNIKMPKIKKGIDFEM